MPRSPGRLTGVLILAFVLFASGLVPSMTSAQSTPVATPANLESTATFEMAPCPFLVPESFVEGQSIECGFLTTPLVHAAPAGEQIRLFVTRLTSLASAPLATPLVFLAGGPGQGGSSQLPGFLPDAPLRPLLDQQDVILIDQRGTGFSEPGLFCPTDVGPSIPGLTPPPGGTTAATTPQPESTPDVAGLLGGVPAEQTAQCLSLLTEQGIDLTAFSSAESAADINDLRVALGHEQVDLYGVSYGSALGFVVERDFPSIVRAAVLASPAPPVAGRFSGQVIAFDESLDTAIAQCEADPACATANPDLSANFDRAVEQLNAAPIEVELLDPTTQQSLGTLPMNGEAFMFAVYQGLFVAPFVPSVPAMITAAVNGQPGSFGTILGAAFSVIQGSISTGLQNSINCTEEYPFVDPEAETATAAESDVRPALANSATFDVVASYESICGVWALPAADPIESEPVVSDVPTLIITGEFDPVTPPSYGELAVETLANGYLVEILGASHDPAAFAGPTGIQLILDFLADPTQRPDTSAIEQNQTDFSPE